MKPGIIYQFQYENAEKLSDQETDDPKQIFVELADMDNLIDDGLEAQTYELEAADSPVRFSTIDNDEDKFTPVKSTQVTIRLLTSNNINMATFAGGSDQRWRVHIKDVNERFFFKGFLSLSDLTEEWMPNPRVLVLTGSDNLGLLKDIPLTESVTSAIGNNPTGYHRIQEILAWCLTKTGLQLQLNAIFNIRAVDFPTAHFFNSQFLDVKTFEDKIGTCVNCRQVLEIILGNEAVLFQRAGEWWILRIDEIENSAGYYVSTFAYDGTFIEHKDIHAFNKVIQKDGSVIFFSGEVTQVTLNRPLRSVKLTYNYKLPLEIPCNVDFSRGALIDGSNPLDQKFDIECWDKLWSNTTSDDPQTTGIYVRRKYIIAGYETERYLVQQANASHFTFVMSEAIPIKAKDKFTISVDRRLSSDDGASGFFRDECVQVRLYGDDGTFWTHHGKTSVANDVPKWVECDATFRTNQKFFCIEGNVNEDQTQSKSLFDGEAAEVPIGGYLKILVYMSSIWGTTKDTYIDRVNFDLHEFINGSYQKYTGQSHEVIQATSTDNFKEKREKEVFMSDSPHPLYKGALFSYNGSAYVLSGLFWNRAVFPGGDPGNPFRHPYGEIQAFDVWNQFRNFVRVFQGQMQGLNTSDLDYLDRIDMASLLHKWFLQDNTENTNNKYFQLLTFDQDLRLCEWKGTLKECYDILIGKIYTDTHIFKYETS